jgi:hypothetical protein
MKRSYTLQPCPAVLCYLSLISWSAPRISVLQKAGAALFRIRSENKNWQKCHSHPRLFPDCATKYQELLATYFFFFFHLLFVCLFIFCRQDSPISCLDTTARYVCVHQILDTVEIKPHKYRRDYPDYIDSINCFFGRSIQDKRPIYCTAAPSIEFLILFLGLLLGSLYRSLTEKRTPSI